MSVSNQVIMVMVQTLNENFSAMSEEDLDSVACDLATAIQVRAAKHNQYLAPNLQRRDVVLALLMFGCDMPVVDLLWKPVQDYLKGLK